MTQDEIIAMARQVGYPIQHFEWQKATEEFAALVAAKKQEDIIQIIKETSSMLFIRWLWLICQMSQLTTKLPKPLKPNSRNSIHEVSI